MSNHHQRIVQVHLAALANSQRVSTRHRTVELNNGKVTANTFDCRPNHSFARVDVVFGSRFGWGIRRAIGEVEDKRSVRTIGSCSNAVTRGGDEIGCDEKPRTERGRALFDKRLCRAESVGAAIAGSLDFEERAGGLEHGFPNQRNSGSRHIQQSRVGFRIKIPSIVIAVDHIGSGSLALRILFAEAGAGCPCGGSQSSEDQQMAQNVR